MRFFIILLILFGCSEKIQPVKVSLESEYEDYFEETECMKTSISFWEKIFIVYSENEMVIHNDTTYKIYKVVKVPPLDNKKARKIAVKSAIENVKSKLSLSEQSQVRGQSGIREKFLKGLKLGETLIPQIQQTLQQQGLPMDLAFIPLIESSFQYNAKSKVGARGAWQIMPKTLKYFDKKANKKQLSDLNYSTKIAMLILKDYYERVGSWPLTVNSYHTGVGRLIKAKNELDTEDMCIISTKYKGRAYKFASRNYYFQFLAARKIYYERLGEEE